MSQHDFDITTLDANSGISVRYEINLALKALASNNSGATEPATKFPYQFWAASGANILKIRKGDNSAWVDLFDLTTGRPSYIPSTVSSAELGYLDGVTSAIQTQLNGKAGVDLFDLTTGRPSYIPSTVSSAELGYLDGVTSAIQTQLNGKADTGTIGNRRGAVQYVNQTVTVPTSIFGGVVILGGAGNTVTLPPTSEIGKSVLFLSQGGAHTIRVDSGVDIGYGGSIFNGGSITLYGVDSVEIVCAGINYWAVLPGKVNGISTCAPLPTTASGVGQWVNLGAIRTGSTLYLPAGGTWAYFFSNNGEGVTGVAAGGSLIWGPGNANNFFGFAWRIS